MENIELEEDETVKAFVGEYQPENYLLKHDKPAGCGPLRHCPVLHGGPRWQQAEAMKNAKRAILDVAADFEKTFGRKYGFFEAYRMEDAEVGHRAHRLLRRHRQGLPWTSCGPQGIKAGLIKIRVFRPFPAEELAEALKHVQGRGCAWTRARAFSACGGPLFAETRFRLLSI